MQVETIKIVSDDFEGGYAVINKDEFDKTKHKEFVEPKPDEKLSAKRN